MTRLVGNEAFLTHPSNVVALRKDYPALVPDLDRLNHASRAWDAKAATLLADLRAEKARVEGRI